MDQIADSFRWRLGTCVPVGILDSKGHISRHQSSLTRLSLLTDGTCPHAQYGLEGLSMLKYLSVLEWEGVQHPVEVESLRQCLNQNKPHLKKLCIGFVSSAISRDLQWRSLGLSSSTPAHHVHDDQNVPDNPVPSLRDMSLSKVSLPLELSPSELVIFGSLRSLTLHNCPHQFDLLRHLAKLKHTIKLTHFEASLDVVPYDPNVISHDGALETFIRSFQGLRHLHLKLSNYPIEKHNALDAIRHHRATLETLIYHERQLSPIGVEGLFEEERDVQTTWTPSLMTVITPHRLAALALCAEPLTAVSFQHFSSLYISILIVTVQIVSTCKTVFAIGSSTLAFRRT